MSNIASRIFRAEKALIERKKFNEDLPDTEDLKSSLFKFCQYFFKLLTGSEFLDRPGEGRLSFLTVVIPVLEGIVSQDPMYRRVAIRCPPRSGKTELVLLFLAWIFAKFPNAQNIYTTYSFQLTVKQTKRLRRIVSLPEFQQLFGMRILQDTRAAHDFQFDTGAQMYGAGANGTIVGTGAGVFGDDFGGLIVMDDIQKPSDVYSEKYRQKSAEWYADTLSTRLNDPKTPILAIGHAIHEDDLIQKLINKEIDHYDWYPVVIPALDNSNRSWMPDKYPKETLLDMKRTSRYVFASQFQQNPVSPGNGLFLEKDFVIMDDYPDNIDITFITADTAETDKTYNDPTVFSFWGVHKLKIDYIETDIYGLHWIDCVEIWIEPKDLQREFMSFYNSCMRFPVKPVLAAIEKKSSGTTLLSVLSDVPGLRIIDIERTGKVIRDKIRGKASRFIEMQQHIASKKISLTKYGKHTKMCVDHMVKITANDSHRYDDICDTAYDAVNLALIDRTLIGLNVKHEEHKVPKGYKSLPRKSFQTWHKI